MSVTVVLLTLLAFANGQDSNSCVGRCGTPVDNTKPCQCNTVCVNFNDCCDDYVDVCQNAGVVTDQEILDMSELLWSLDDSRAAPGDVSYNVAGMRLFEHVNENKLFIQPTWSRFLDLLDNYNTVIGIPETCGTVCLLEQEAFLDAAMQTRVMQQAWTFLSSKNLVGNTEEGFKQNLKDAWFQLYSRSSGPLDSSGFEHVMLGELRSSMTDMTGMHNWIRFYLEEKEGLLSYDNFLDLCQPDIVKMALTWLGAYKPITSIWIGTSPEFELALYTVCFYARPAGGDSCRVSMQGNREIITTFEMNGVVPRAVGTSYPKC